MSESGSPQGPYGSNTHHGKDRNAIVSIVVCMAIAGLVVAGRFVSRRLKGVNSGISEWLALGGLAGAWIVSALVIEGKNHRLLFSQCA